MNANKMMQLCDTALNKLDELEMLLSYIPIERDAARFTYESIAAVNELRHIAKLETEHAVTIEQAAHISHILAKTSFFLDLVPNTAKGGLDDEPDNG